MSNNLVKPERLTAIMLELGLEIEDIAKKTESSTRSVYRWMEYGMPKAKYELLRLKIK